MPSGRGGSLELTPNQDPAASSKWQADDRNAPENLRGMDGPGRTNPVDGREGVRFGRDSFSSIALGDFLDLDPRPTFVLDLEADCEYTTSLAYYNPAFRAIDGLIAEISTKCKPNPSINDVQSSFTAWAKHKHRRSSSRESTSTSTRHRGLVWNSVILKQRWNIISGSNTHNVASISKDLPSTPPEMSAEAPLERTWTSAMNEIQPRNSTPHAENGGARVRQGAVVQDQSSTRNRTPDWTVSHPEGELSSHVRFARTIKWENTPLGSMDTWSRELRQLVNKLMADPHPAVLYWGEELTMIYNEPYAIGVAGRKHPKLMGTGFRGPFREIWADVGEIFQEVKKSGIGRAQVDQMLPIERFGFMEETFFCWSLIPIYGGTNEVLGMWNSPFETTRSTLGQRRMNTLLRIGEEVSLAKSVSSFWALVLRSLEENEYDFPFALLYSVTDDTEADDGSSRSFESSYETKGCVLEGSLGVPEGHDAAPSTLDLKRAKGGFIPAIQDAMRTKELTMLNIADGTLSESLIRGFAWRGFGEPCRQAVVCPLRPATGEDVMGFLVVGINPRRPFDADYQTFIRLLKRQLATSLASVTLFAEERRRGSSAAEAAALEKMRLSEELAVQRSRLQRMAEVSPVGMFSMNDEGYLIEANDRWFEMTGHPRDSALRISWFDLIKDECVPCMRDGWRTLTVDGLPWSGELKMRKHWHDPATGELVEHWVLAASQPEFSSDGRLKTVMSYITDITLQKRSAHDAMTRAKLSEELLLRTQEAKENEKNFKRFTDIVPGGLFITDAHQRITYANSQWFRISGHPDFNSQDPLSWSLPVLDADQPLFNARWEEMTRSHITMTVEVRMRTPLVLDLGGALQEVQRWILVSAVPEISAAGLLLNVMGCITDISRIKWAEDVQNRRLIEADENRRQQNNFIDMTSHEMRNPLSAILQCADGIASSLIEYQAEGGKSDAMFEEIVKSSIEAAETIQLCAHHQKSIVDDILTVSKLDSDLLVITPAAVEPIEVVRQCLKMFFAECLMNKIEMEFHVDESLARLQVDRVMLDSSRLLQVLINLLTNAIKFTKAEEKRSIYVSLSAYLTPPEQQSTEIEYLPTQGDPSATAGSGDWGTGESLYLGFQVRDTGCGLSPDEKKLLFTRFSQASPKTHTKYGGSGLGLFISRQLTELQGGEIGVASQSGVGSTFAFYVRTRRAPPDDDVSNRQALHKVNSQRNVRLPTDPPTSTKDGIKQGLSVYHKPGVTPLNPEAGNINASDLHVLIVEDNVVNQRILAAQIKKLGCTVYVANHGGEALDVLRETNLHKDQGQNGKDLSVILMDLEMPVMDGLTCIRKIRDMQASGSIVRHIPIIAVTANVRGEQIAAAKDSGVVCWICLEWIMLTCC
ncbi:hsp90-like protein [Phlyctema vagabunda]|uniref:Hsp90-like protein n=1 Tax=Phlyctema vagabunda TaxID=108571 RepID=A0ABR4PVB3_9HELO